MVSIRRRRLLGLCSGVPKAESCVRKQPWRSSFLFPLSKFLDNGNALANHIHDKKPVSVHPMPSLDSEQPKDETISKASPGSSNASGHSSSKEQHGQKYPEVKRRKRHRRKQCENQEACLMRGVYYKNLKWQAAIKVEKKQIHLGTVGSQEEAARLYDRAAFMCGREPNFELSEEEKQELSQLKWDEFLAMTRSTITNKKPRRRNGPFIRAKPEPSKENSDDGEDEQGGSGNSSSEIDPDTSGP